MKNSLSSYYKFFVVLLLTSILAACGTGGKKRSGAYYQDDGPGRKKVDIDSVQNAVPRDEPFNQASLKPYTINGKRYVPLQSSEAFLQEGRASWYGKKYHGRKTSNGETYDMYKMTAAHPTLPLPSYVRVTNVVNQRSVIVRVNDRGPFIGDRIIDLSYVAARKLDVASAGTGNVIVESVSPSNRSKNTAAVQSLGEIPAARKFNLPASQQTQANQAVQQRASRLPTPNQTPQQQTPQLVPSNDGVTNGSGANTQVAESVTPKYQAAEPRFTTEKWIQVGAFSVKNNAEKLASRLNTSGYQNVRVSQKNNLYKVLVGPLSQQQLTSTQRSLKTNGYSAIIATP